LKEVVKAFGDSILTDDGNINRKALGAIVFSSKSEMEKLNLIMWPAILKLLRAKVHECIERSTKVVVVEAAILVESGWYTDDIFNEIWVVTAPRELSLRRIMARNSLSEEDASKRIDAQMASEERIKYGKVIINNDDTVDELKSRLDKIWGDFECRC
jgi:dephospho-CoA kinase